MSVTNRLQTSLAHDSHGAHRPRTRVRRSGTGRAAGALTVSALLAIPAGALLAAGTIDTTGATIAAGAAPTPGAVVVSSSAELPPLPPVPEMSRAAGNEVPRFEGDKTFAGPGGADLHVTSDLVLPPGVYDVGALTVDAGVTLRFDGASTLRIAGDAVVRGIVEFVPHASGRFSGEELSIECGGAMTVAASRGADSAGFRIGGVGPVPHGVLRVDVRGPLACDAEPGSTAVIAAAGTRNAVRLYAYAPGITSIRSTRFVGAIDAASTLAVAGDLLLEACATSGERAIAISVPDGGASVDGGDFAPGLTLSARHDASITGRVTVGGRTLHVLSSRGTVTIGGGVDASVVAMAQIRATGDVRIRGGARIAVGGEDSPASGLRIVSTDGSVRIDDGAALDAGANARLYVSGEAGTVFAGSLRSASNCELRAVFGDVVLEGTAVIDSPASTTTVRAGGAIVAEGGTVAWHAGAAQLVAATGGIDLDLARLSTGTGDLDASAAGAIRLRGAFESARDVAFVSRRDGADVAGADIRTADVTNSLSGSVRISTYASDAQIDARGATLRSGDSAAISGDVRVEIAAEGSATTARAASTNGISRSASVLERMMRATLGTRGMAMAMIVLPSEGPSEAAITSAITSSGNACMMSISRCTMRSTQPPKKPDMSPTAVPIRHPRSVAPTPTASEMRAP